MGYFSDLNMDMNSLEALDKKSVHINSNRGYASEACFTTDIPDLQGLIRRLNMFNKETNTALRKSLHRCGERTKNAQRRRISGRKVGKKLVDHINCGSIYTTKKGGIGISSGYQANAFKTDSEGFNPGIVGMTNEFGRPGSSVFEAFGIDRTSETMLQERNGKEVEVKKGAIQPLSHIRAGSDETLEENIRDVKNTVNNLLDKLGGGT